MSTDKPTVFVTRQIPAMGLEAIARVAEMRVHEKPMPPTRQELLQGVQGCAGILSLLSDRIDSEVFDAAGANLRVVSNFAVGYNNIDVTEAKRRDISVGNTPDVLTDATADIAVALILAAARRLREAADGVIHGQWKTWEPLGWIGMDLRGKTLGIVGMGRIGQATAERLVHGWQMKLLYTSRSPKPDVDRQLGGRHVALDELLSDSDVISVHVSLSPETRHLINAEALSKVKLNTVLVNTSRGEVIDQMALVTALKKQQLFAAGLDVCDPEPLPVNHPLLELPNCIVLPHIGSATVSARNAMAQRAARNLIAGIQGQPLPFAVHQSHLHTHPTNQT
ncbi:MAG: D-glycerate dehydrogenase [Pirellulaceae bacterium]|nr:D-glycerate dehydrogenase [Pirellulaceae bacterium]